MKRKTGIVLALALAFVGVVAFGGDNAGALGRGENTTYCKTYSYSQSEAENCAIVLRGYHLDETYDGGKKLFRDGWQTSGSDAWNETKKSIEKHIQDSQYAKNNTSMTYDTFVGKVMENAKNDNVFSSNGVKKPSFEIAECYVNNTYQSECLRQKIKTVGNIKAGMSYHPVCFTEYGFWDAFKGDCFPGNQNAADDPDNPYTKDLPKPNESDSGDVNKVGELDTDVAGSENCSTLFPNEWCSADGIGSILSFVVAVLTGTVVVAGTVGIIICAVLILTARDNEQQLATGKKRLMEVVIGMIAWIMLSVIVNLFIPKTSKKIETEVNNATIINVEEEKA